MILTSPIAKESAQRCAVGSKKTKKEAGHQSRNEPSIKKRVINKKSWYCNSCKIQNSQRQKGVTCVKLACKILLRNNNNYVVSITYVQKIILLLNSRSSNNLRTKNDTDRTRTCAEELQQISNLSP